MSAMDACGALEDSLEDACCCCCCDRTACALASAAATDSLALASAAILRISMAVFMVSEAVLMVNERSLPSLAESDRCKIRRWRSSSSSLLPQLLPLLVLFPSGSRGFLLPSTDQLLNLTKFHEAGGEVGR